jgi:hypothetical protein
MHRKEIIHHKPILHTDFESCQPMLIAHCTDPLQPPQGILTM